MMSCGCIVSMRMIVILSRERRSNFVTQKEVERKQLLNESLV